MGVRDLVWTDFSGWVELYYSRYEEIERNPDLGVYLHASRPTESEEAVLFGQLMKAVLDHDLVAAVFETDGRMVGTCTVGRSGHHLEDRHVGQLGIAVHPDWRGKGVGHALLEYVLERCRGTFEIVELKVVTINSTAIRLYQRHGFTECGRLPRSFKRGDRYLDELVMSRPIEPPR